MIRLIIGKIKGDGDCVWLSLLLFLLVITACENNRQLSYAGLTKEYFQQSSAEGLKTNSLHVRDEIARLSKADRDSADADAYARAYYKRGGDFIWIDRYGVKNRADSLIAFLDTAALNGFKVNKEQLDRVRENVERVRKLAFADEDAEQMNEALAQVEYQLTKNFLRYGVGLRYGLTNPERALNKLDVKDSDSIRVTYRELFDLKIPVSGSKTYAEALRLVSVDSLSHYLQAAQPADPAYQKLKEKLRGATGSERELILVNMERLRWRTHDAPYKNKEYIVVNIPAYHLWAVRDGEILDMKVGCGARKTKTPLLNSRIHRMDVNPQWVIPGSIVTKDIIHHAGDGEYFDNRHYFAQHRKSGKRLYGYDITYSVIASNEYFIIQKGGEGNSLGRIIFRFQNDFAIYLHDTPSRSFFSRENRSVSHGCIRVERPYDLACFLLRGDDDKAEMVRYSMENDITSETVDKSMLINSINVDPNVPIFITYQTLFLTPEGKIERYPDVYGYDAVLLKELRRYGL